MPIILQSDRLRVEIIEPGMYPNTTYRFDRAGFITQLTLDGKYQFCTREPDNLSHPCSGGIGFCNEYMMEEASTECKVGEKFPKLGIGLFTRNEDAPYVFFRPYDCDPFKIRWESEMDSVRFITEAKPCMGYAAQHIKTLRVTRNELSMTIQVENTGERPLRFQEYCHNFITLEHLPLGSAYHLQMNVKDQSNKKPFKGDSLCAKGDIISFNKYSNEASMIAIDSGEIQGSLPFKWKLSHDFSPVSVEGRVSQTPSSINIWAIDHIISPEIICSFDIEPGARATWTRSWIFRAYDC